MRVLCFALACVLALTLVVPEAPAQKKSDRKAAQSKERDDLADLRREFQPRADQVALGMVRRTYRDPLVSGYINALGQSLVPPEASPDLSFSFRVVNDPSPNAFALPDGRIFVTCGLLAFVENEAQLAVVLGHEIAHVTEQHALNEIKRQRSSQKRNKVIGTAAGAAIGGLLGGRKGGGSEAAVAAATGAAVGLMIASGINSILRGKYSKKQEQEADLIGTEIAMANGFDPEEGARLFEKLHDRFGRRGSGSPALARTLNDADAPVDLAMSGHPRPSERMTEIRNLISGELQDRFSELQSNGDLSKGSGRFKRMASGLRRDASILLAEFADRYDLALEGLEEVNKIRPNDSRVLWAMGRIYRLAGRTDEHMQKAQELLQQAIDADKRKLFPAIHRDIAFLHATRSDDYVAAAEALKLYVLGYIRKHGSYPHDLETVYDHLVLFGDSEWVAPAAVQPQRPLVAEYKYAPEVWDTPISARVDSLGYALLSEGFSEGANSVHEVDLND